MTLYDIIKQGLSLVYETPVTDADARRFSTTIMQTLIVDCYDAEQNSRADDDQLTGVPKITEGGSGDVDGDGEVTAADASMILRYTQGLTALTDAQKEAADVNGDGVVDAKDAEMILMYLVRLVSIDTSLPYNDYLTTVALPYGVAWKWCEANNRREDAMMYHALYEEAKHIGGRGKWNLA